MEVTTALKIIDEGAFESTGLYEISLPQSVKVIGDAAFRRCRSLTNANIQHVEEIGENAFMGTTISNVVLSKNCRVAKTAFRDKERVIKGEEEGNSC